MARFLLFCAAFPLAALGSDISCGEDFITLDFENAIMVHNNLCGQGPTVGDPPEMFMTNLGTAANGEEIGLVITCVTDGPGYTAKDVSKNGLDDGFVQINMLAPSDAWFDFQFVEARTRNPLDVGTGGLLFYDIDTNGETPDDPVAGETREYISVCPHSHQAVLLSNQYLEPYNYCTRLYSEVKVLGGNLCAAYTMNEPMYDVSNPKDAQDLDGVTLPNTLAYFWDPLEHFQLMYSVVKNKSREGGRNFYFAGLAEDMIECPDTTSTTTQSSTTTTSESETTFTGSETTITGSETTGTTKTRTSESSTTTVSTFSSTTTKTRTSESSTTTVSTFSSTTTTTETPCLANKCEICGANETCLQAIWCKYKEIRTPGDSEDPDDVPDRNTACDLAQKIVHLRCPQCNECTACPEIEPPFPIPGPKPDNCLEALPNRGTTRLFDIAPPAPEEPRATLRMSGVGIFAASAVASTALSGLLAVLARRRGRFFTHVPREHRDESQEFTEASDSQID